MTADQRLLDLVGRRSVVSLGACGRCARVAGVRAAGDD